MWVVLDVECRDLGELDFRTRFQLHGGRIVTSDEFEQSYNELSSEVSNTPHMPAWTTEIRVVRARTTRSGEFKIRAKVDAVDEWSLRWHFYTTANRIHKRIRVMAVDVARGRAGALAFLSWLSVR